MRAEALLISVAVVALAVVVVATLAIPGFVADPTVTEQPARLDVEESTLQTSEVTAETATFDVTAYIQHHGGAAENVSVVVRATDEESGVVVDTTTRSLGALQESGEHDLTVPVTVPREGSYTIASILYVDGERTDVARTTIRGVEALTPPHADSRIEFHDFVERPSVEYTIESVEDDTVTLSVWSYLTNTGDSAESDLRLEVTARQAESNVVAAREEVTVGSIEAGRTAPTEVTVTVPDEYNYYLDATLWRDDVVIDSTITAANLDPRETIAVNETREPVRFEAEAFETDRDPDRPEEEFSELEEEQPGFGLVAAIIGIAGGLFAVRRWST